MVLAVDIGNSNIVVGAVGKNGVRFVERIYADRNKTDLEYAISFKMIMEIYNITADNIKGSIISSVVPPITATVNSALKKLTGAPAIIVGPGVKNGLNIKIDNPAQLGSDLVVDAVAGVAEYPLPQIIIDMGTATTISVINQDARFMGGAIVPGVLISMESLVADTSQLPRISLEAPKKVIGSNTIDSMKSGMILGNASMLDGMIDRIEKELGTKATVIATGGLAKFVIPHCVHKIIYDDALLLKGLYLIYMRNCEEESKPDLPS